MNIENNLNYNEENDFIEKSILSTVNGIVLFISSINDETYNLTIEELNEKIAHYYKYKILQGLVSASNYNRTQTPIDAIMAVFILGDTYIVIEYESVAYISVNSITVYTPKEDVFYKYSNIEDIKINEISSIDPNYILSQKIENEMKRNIDRLSSKFSRKIDWFIENFQEDYSTTRNVIRYFSTPDELNTLDYYSFDFLLNEWNYSIELLAGDNEAKIMEIHTLLKGVMIKEISETYGVNLQNIEYNNDNLRIKYYALDILRNFGDSWDFYTKHRNPIIQKEDAIVINEYLNNEESIEFINSIIDKEINTLTLEDKCNLISIFSQLDLNDIFGKHKSTYKVIYDTFGPFMSIIKYLKDANPEIKLSTSYNEIPPVNEENMDKYIDILLGYFPTEFSKILTILINFAL